MNVHVTPEWWEAFCHRYPTITLAPLGGLVRVADHCIGHIPLPENEEGSSSLIQQSVREGVRLDRLAVALPSSCPRSFFVCVRVTVRYWLLFSRIFVLV